MTEVEVIRRWHGSAVNGRGPNGEAGEHCGVPDPLAEELAASGLAKIVRRNVPPTERIGADGVVGSDANQNRTAEKLYELVTELLTELRAARKKN